MELDFRKHPAILSTVVDAMEIGVFTVNRQGHFVAWSRGAERITGYTSDEVIDRPCELLEGPNCKGFASLAAMLTSPNAAPRGICNQECKLMSKDGRELYIHGNVCLLRDDQGRVQGAVGTFTDMTSFVLANERIALLERQTRPGDAFQKMVGRSAPMQEVFRRLRLAAETEVSVLLTGESGTGKELAAAAIHSLSARAAKPFLAVNCSAIPETLLESELFGHVKGAFTGAIRDKMGLFEAADGGTLFLDEIGELSSTMQVTLLRVLQDQQIRRVGDQQARRVNVRLVTATNRDLRESLANGQMRDDFYYRINVFPIHLPPLRERREDIPLLVEHFLRELCPETGRSIRGIARDALQLMLDYDWPGNIRQLRNAVEHACVTVSGDQISLLDLPPEIRESARPKADREAQPFSAEQRAERDRIAAALRQFDGNRTRTAQHLGISRVTLWKKIRRYGLAGE